MLRFFDICPTVAQYRAPSARGQIAWPTQPHNSAILNVAVRFAEQQTVRKNRAAEIFDRSSDSNPNRVRYDADAKSSLSNLHRGLTTRTR